MSDDETTDSSEAVTPASEPAGTSNARDNGDRGGVHIPQWLAGALVVVLALLIGAVGYAIGASSNDGGGREFRPINASEGGQQGGQGGGFPGGPGGQQGGPQAGPGGQQGPGGGGFPGGGPQIDDDRGERGDRQDQDDQDSQDDSTDDQDEGANY